MIKRLICLSALLWTLPESRPCMSIPEIPRDQEQVYTSSRDSAIIDDNGTLMDALVLSTRRILYTGAAFIVTDTIRLRPGNPYPYHREIVVVRKDSGGAPPRELDFCNYVDSIDTVLAYEEDSLFIAFLPSERSQGGIMALFSLQEGFLYYYGAGHDSSGYMASRSDEEGLRKTFFAQTYQNRQAGIIRAAKHRKVPKPAGLPGFAFGNSRFDAIGRFLTFEMPE